MTSSDSFSDPLGFGRQLWQQWNAAMQTASPAMAAAGPLPDWQSALQQWGGLFNQDGGDARRAADKLALHGQQFFALMQTLMPAAVHGGAPDVAALWKGALGGDGNPLLDALRQVGTEGARGWEQWFDLSKSTATPFRDDWKGMLNAPAFGMGRERQAAFNALLQAQAAYAEAVQVYQQLLSKANQLGVERFESKLAERSEPGRQLDSMRALFDLWVDAAEDAYAQIALSPEFRDAYGQLVDCQMRVKQLQNKAIEQMAAEAGMPTRSELDGVLQKLKSLQREVRHLREQQAQAEGGVAKPVAPAKQSEVATPVPAPAKAARKSTAALKSVPAKAVKTPASRRTRAAKAAKAVPTRPATRRRGEG